MIFLEIYFVLPFLFKCFEADPYQAKDKISFLKSIQNFGLMEIPIGQFFPSTNIPFFYNANISENKYQSSFCAVSIDSTKTNIFKTANFKFFPDNDLKIGFEFDGFLPIHNKGEDLTDDYFDRFKDIKNLVALKAEIQNLTTKGLINISKLSNLECLWIETDAELFNKQDLQELSRLQKLKFLYYQCKNDVKNSSKFDLKFLNGNQEISDLVIYSSALKLSDFDDLKLCKNLKSFSFIFDCPKIENEKILPVFGSVKHLEIHCHSVVNLKSIFKCFPNVSILKVANSSAIIDDVKLVNLKYLRNLSINFASCDDKITDEQVDFLTNQQALEILKVWGVKPSNYFFKKIKELKKLQQIMMSCSEEELPFFQEYSSIFKEKTGIKLTFFVRRFRN